MFRKLRNTLLLFNISITGIVILAAFGTIYWITSSSIQADIHAKLYNVPQIEFSGGGGASLSAQVQDSDSLDTESQIVINASEMFSLETDSAGKLVEIYSALELPETAYEPAARQALTLKNSSSLIHWQGKQWRCRIVAVQEAAEGSAKEDASLAKQRLRITFLDVTDSYKTLNALRNTLLAVGAAVLFLLAAISFFFANRAIRPVIEAWAKQKQFVSDASHELKTPLSIVNANLGVLLENRSETVGSQLKWLEYIQAGTDRMTKLIYDLLALARMEDSSRQPQARTFDLSHTVEEVLSTFEAAIILKNITLTQSGVPQAIVKEDEERIRHLLQILVDNAVKYVDEGGEIHVSVTRIKSRVQFEITNTGEGIGQEELPKVFDRFYRTDSSRTYESGSFGLGLAIAKSIVEQAGGSIAVQSKAGQTAFMFTLKLQ
ncbi:cell wall metabolism sensor histidine kinase WalK [Paenibacillus sp. S150]|uniref:sensor histidine kinase n=1 Tax=Paenibacillus sp. S150 TaxID=2749826 RepID=UPI001C57B513|nr:HAMP domain-containing sensor histidine kinase [Paenibacillus sp. S150]MBW4081986.1 GHKL domain-containing protein [Paenibacillus sp. S150]